MRWTESRRVAVMLGSVAALYLPVFANGLVFDDTALIVDSRVIHDVRNLPALFVHSTMYASAQYSGGANAVDTYRPVSLATFMWDALVSGSAPFSYHLTNLVAHLLCVLLVYRLARAMLPEAERDKAWIGAAWFGLTPLPAEAHVWINGRSDVFATLFGLCALLAWRRALRASGAARVSWYVACGLAFLCGLLTKEVLLLSTIAILAWPEPEPVALRQRVLRTAPFAVAGACYLALRAHALGGIRSYQSATQVGRALLQLPWLLLDAAFQSVLPTRPYLRLMREEYAHVPLSMFVLAAVALLAVAGLALAYRRRAPVATWGLLWFVLPLVPVSIISTMYWPGFGRYLYLPCVGLALTLTTLAARLWHAQPRLRRILAAALATYFAIGALVLEGVIASYHDSGTLYARVIDFRPELGYGYGMLAAALSTRLDDLDKVVQLFERAERLDPAEARYPTQHAQTYLVLQQPRQAAALAERALQRFPSDPMLHYVAAVGRMPDPEPVVRHLAQCLEIEIGFARCHTALAALRADAGLCERFRPALHAAARRTTHPGVRVLLERTSAGCAHAAPH